MIPIISEISLGFKSGTKTIWYKMYFLNQKNTKCYKIEESKGNK